MLTTPAAPFRKRRARRKPAAAPPTPSDPNEITDWGDAHSQGDFQIRLTVAGQVTAIDAPFGFEVYDGDLWWPMISADLSLLPLLTLTFANDVTGAFQWRVTNPAAWHFANGQPLVAPYEGMFP